MNLSGIKISALPSYSGTLPDAAAFVLSYNSANYRLTLAELKALVEAGQAADPTLTALSGLTGAGYIKASGTDTFSMVSSIQVSDLTGTLPVTQGGTGVTSLNDLFTALGLGSSATYAASAFAAASHSHPWVDITDKPSTFAPSAHSHLWVDITDKPSTFDPSAHGHDWGSITSKPSTFAPSAHSHLWADITDKPSTFTPSAHSHLWADITDKPSTFTPSSHTHGADALTLGGLSGTGALTWNGTSWSLNTTLSTVAWADITGKPGFFAPTAHGHDAVDISGNVLELGIGNSTTPVLFDFHTADDTYSDYSARLLRGGGANSTFHLENRGTGELQLVAVDAGSIGFWVNGSRRGGFSSSGEFSTTDYRLFGHIMSQTDASYFGVTGSGVYDATVARFEILGKGFPTIPNQSTIYSSRFLVRPVDGNGAWIDASASGVAINGDPGGPEGFRVGGNSRTSGYSAASTLIAWSALAPTTQGAYLGWNRLEGTGATTLYNQRGLGGGGIEFSEYYDGAHHTTFFVDAEGGVHLSPVGAEGAQIYWENQPSYPAFVTDIVGNTFRQFVNADRDTLVSLFNDHASFRMNLAVDGLITANSEQFALGGGAVGLSSGAYLMRVGLEGAGHLAIDWASIQSKNTATGYNNLHLNPHGGMTIAGSQFQAQEQTAGTGTSWFHVASAIAPNMVSGDRNILTVGKSISGGNAGWMAYAYSSDPGSQELTLGFYGQSGSFRLIQRGEATLFGDPGGSETLRVNGSGRFSGNLTAYGTGDRRVIAYGAPGVFESANSTSGTSSYLFTASDGTLCLYPVDKYGVRVRSTDGVVFLGSGNTWADSAGIMATQRFCNGTIWGTGQAGARNHFHQYNAGTAGWASGWIAAAFGDSTAPRAVIGQVEGKAIFGAHTGDLSAWAPLYLGWDSSVIVGTSDPGGSERFRINGAARVAGDLVVTGSLIAPGATPFSLNEYHLWGALQGFSAGLVCGTDPGGAQALRVSGGAVVTGGAEVTGGLTVQGGLAVSVTTIAATASSQTLDIPGGYSMVVLTGNYTGLTARLPAGSPAGTHVLVKNRTGQTVLVTATSGTINGGGGYSVASGFTDLSFISMGGNAWYF